MSIITLSHNQKPNQNPNEIKYGCQTNGRKYLSLDHTATSNVTITENKTKTLSCMTSTY